MLKYTTWTKVPSDLRFSVLSHELETKEINMGTYKELRGWLFYYTKYISTHTDIITLNKSIYDLEDTMHYLEREFHRKNITDDFPEILPPFSTPSTTPSTHTTPKESLSFRKLAPSTTNNEFEPTIKHAYNRPTIYFVQNTSYTSHMNSTHRYLHSLTQSEVRDTTCNSSTATTDSFHHDFDEKYEATRDNFHSPPQVVNETFSNYLRPQSPRR